MSANNIIKAIAIAAIVLAGLKIGRDAIVKSLGETEPAATQQPEPEMVSEPIQAEPVSVSVEQPANLQPMTGDDCAAAGAAAGWSATWGSATDGCWLVSPDGTETRHVGTWKE